MAVHSGDRAHWNRIAFIAGLAERHWGNYSLYCETIDATADAKQWRKILNKVWEYLSGQLNSMKNLEKALLQLEELTPEPTDQDGYGIYPALDACLLLTSALQMILDDSIDDSDTAAELSKATVAQFIALSEGLEEFDPEQHQFELYQEEVHWQQHLSNRLEADQPQAEIIKQLRRELSEFTSSNLGIALEN